MNRLIFVYGTLQKGQKAHNLIEKYVEFLGKCYIKGEIFQISYYPGVILNNKGVVYGELYKIKYSFFKVLKILDDYEEASLKFKLPREYKRRLTDVYCKDKRVKAWVYEYNKLLLGVKK